MIGRPNQVRRADTACPPMRRGFLRPVAGMDRAARKALAWRASNTPDVEFCPEVPEEAPARSGRPEIFNTGQGGQFASPRFTGLLRQAGVRISMDGRGRRMDDASIERPWRGPQRECVCPRAFETGSELRAGLPEWIGRHNAERPHSGLNGRTPNEAYGGHRTARSAA